MMIPAMDLSREVRGTNPVRVKIAAREAAKRLERLFRVLEDPRCPEEEKALFRAEEQIALCRAYLAEARKSIERAGGVYRLSPIEAADALFQDSLGRIRQLSLIFDGDPPNERRLTVRPDGIVENTDGFVWGGRGALISALRPLHLGEWQKDYSCKSYGVYLPGARYWNFTVTYADETPARIFGGYGCRPYNFGKLCEVFSHPIL